MNLLAIIQIISGLQLVVSSLIYFALSSWANTPEGAAELAKSGDWALKNGSGLFFLLGIVYLILGVSSLLLARGYVKGREWARHKGRVVAALAMVFAIVGAILLPRRLDPGSPFWTIVFNAIVIIYLGSAKVRNFFSSRR